MTVINLHSIISGIKDSITSSLRCTHAKLNQLKENTEQLLRKIKRKEKQLTRDYKPRISETIRGVFQSTFALSFNLFGLLAGYILASSFDVFYHYSWAIVMFPGLLSVRGAIGGLYAGRLSTALHLGTIKPQFKDNTDEAKSLNASIVILTYISAVFLSISVSVTCIVFYGLQLDDVLYVFLVAFSVMSISILIISPTTVFISIQAFLKGLDPDMIVYPAISTIADVTVSLTFVAILVLLSNYPMVYVLLAGISLVFTILSYRGYRMNHSDTEYMETLKEFTLTLLCVSIIVNYTGNTLRNITQRIGSKPEVYMIYPAIIDTVGDAGSIIGSTATTKLRLGLMGSRIHDIRGHFKDILYSWTGSLFMFIVYSFISSYFYGSEALLSLVLTVALTNLLVIPTIAFLSFLVGILTFQHGLNPDNFIIPIESSIADGMTTYILYLVIQLIYFS